MQAIHLLLPLTLLHICHSPARAGGAAHLGGFEKPQIAYCSFHAQILCGNEHKSKQKCNTCFYCLNLQYIYIYTVNSLTVSACSLYHLLTISKNATEDFFLLILKSNAYHP